MIAVEADVSMDLCKRHDVAKLVRAGEIDLRVDDDRRRLPIEYLDQYRIGLRIDKLMHLSGTVDLRTSIRATNKPLDVEAAVLEPGQFYLATTRERIRLAADCFASVHTRSKYARVGFETLTSSNFVVPGFGSTGPAPIVLEITTRLPVSGLTRESIYCFLLIYRGADSLVRNTKNYLERFPMSSLER